MSQGDQFALDLISGARSVEGAGGFLDDAPPGLKLFVQRLIQSGRSLPKRALAPAYLRSGVVDSERREYLEKRGQRFRAANELPTGMREAIAEACSHPMQFIALTLGQGLAVRSTPAANWEFVSIGSLAFQSTLFSSAEGGSAPAQEGRK